MSNTRMKRSVSVTEKWGRVTRYTAENDVGDGYVVWADDCGEPGKFGVVVERRTPDGRLCGPSSHFVPGLVAGGPGVSKRIMRAGIAAVSSGRARHDREGCAVCAPASVRAS